MDFKTKSFMLVLLLLIVGIGSVSASDIGGANNTMCSDISTTPNNDLCSDNVLTISVDDFQGENHSKSSDSQELLGDGESDMIVVENWDELQYYCSLKDDDYTLKLKENTSFYPTNPNDSNYQIKVNNKVKIIGSEGSYIGYNSSNAPSIKYAAIIVPDGAKSGIYMENVNFKWIRTDYGSDGVFLQMGGNRNNVFKNCQFSYITTNKGHSCIVYLKKGTATLDNCSFIKCTTDYGCVSVYDPNSVKTTDMVIRNCYFEGNYAKTEPGCINNCGKLTVYNTTFFKNKSYWWAGAIHTHSSGNTTIYDSNFTDNVAGWNGGALYTYSYLQIYNTVFVGNNCTTNSGGGAIGACSHISKPHIYIENCLFEKNENLCWEIDELSYGTGVGGAISIMDDGTIEVLNTTFIANSAAHGTAISANAAGEYGSPGIIIKNNTFINHTRVGDVLYVNLEGTSAIIEDNYFYGNSVEFSSLTLKKISENKDQAVLEVSASLTNPQYYDSDILNKTLYDVYIEGEYVKTVNSNIFTVDFDDLNMFDVFVIPTISNKKSNTLTVASVGSYIYVSKSIGNDGNNGTLRETPVNTLKRALELLSNDSNIVILDGCYDEENFQINQDLTIMGSGDVIFANKTSFTINADNFTLKNIGIINLTVDTFIKQEKGDLLISNCIFNNNKCSRLIDAYNVDIVKSIFTNNNVVVYNNGFVNVKNSVLLNNTKIIDNNVDGYVLDYNWWGNTLNNLSKPSNFNINNWLILNATSNVDTLEYGQSSQIQFNCYLIEDNKISKYNDLSKFNFEITTVNGTVNNDRVSYNSNVVYTHCSNGDGIFTAGYNGVSFSLYFDFVKTSPNISIKTSDIMYGQKLEVTIIAPDDIADSKGTYKVSVGDYSLTKRTSNNEFSFNNLEAGNYDVTVVFSGNVKYANQTVSCKVNVNKYDSTTEIITGDINVGSDLTITVKTTKGTTGNITFYINNNAQTLTLTNNQASYTIKNVTRGDYLIRAVYNGDMKYASSEDSIFLEIDNLEPTMTVLAHNSTYGEASLVEVILNDDAGGFVTVSVDGVSNTSEVVNGKAMVHIWGVDVGLNKKVTIFYTGDNNYFNKTSSSNISIFKGNLTFAMDCKDIYIGHDEIITITVPSKTKGTFTIDGNVFTIPMSGEVSYILSDLEVGNYTVTAVFEGDNYNTAINTTSFKVMDFDSPIWANIGGDTLNTQKSPYDFNGEGAVLWFSQIDDSIISNIVIDCDGNIYVTTNYDIYSYDCEGNLRWIYQSDGRLGNFSGLTVGRDVIISPRAGDRLYFINQSGGEKYGSSNIYQASSLFSPIIDFNADIYTVSEYQIESSGYNLVITPYKLWENGGDPILISLGSRKPIASPVVNKDIFVVLCENTLMIFDANSRSLNTVKTGDFKNVMPVIGDGNIVYTILGDSIIGFNLNGLQYGKIIPITGGAGDKLLIDNDLGIYATNCEGKLYRYDIFTGEESLIFDLEITSGILIDTNNNLYFGSNNFFYCIDSDGNILWKSNLYSEITGNPVMDNNNVIYVTTNDKLFALSNITLKDSNMSVHVNNVTCGEDIVINVTFGSIASGNVSFTVNGVLYDGVISNGEVVMVISNLPAGTYDINVTYGGDLIFASQSISSSFIVKKSYPNVSVNVVNINYGEDLVFSVNSVDDATGKVNLLINGKTITQDISEKVITVSNLDAGNYTYIFTYAGDDKYENATIEGRVCVLKINTSLSVKSSDINVGDVEIINVSIPEKTNGNVSLSINNKTYSTAIINGTGNIAIGNLTYGTYEVTLKFTSFNFNDCESSTNFTVSKVKLDKNVLTVTNGIVYVINLPLDAAGTLTVSLNNKNYTKEVSNGVGQIVLSDLTPGNYTASVSYSGDAKYEGIKFDDVFISLDKLFSVVSVSVDDIYVGETAVINVTLTPIKTGSVVVNVNNKNYTVEIKNSTGSLPVLNLTSGNYSVVVSYDGDDTYMSCKNTTGFNVLKVNVPVTNETITIPESDSTEYSISLPSDATGTLTVTVDGVNHTQSLINGKATVNIPELTPGSHNITVTYSGDSKYSPILKSSIVDVPKFDSQLSVNVSDINVDETAVITIEITFKATGNVTITLDNKEYAENISNGVVNFQVEGLRVGTYAVVVKYLGDDKFNGCESTTSFNVLKVNVPVTNGTITTPEGESTEYSISLPDDATGTLTVTVDGVPYTQSLSNGKATVNIPELAEGSYNITVTYSGDAKYSPISKSCVVVKEHVPVIKLTGSNLNMLYTSGKYFKVRLTSDGQPLANKSVKITINGKTYSKTTDKNGYASIKISLAPKTYTVKATYANLTVTKKVTVKSIITAKNVNAKKSAKTVKIKVTLKKVNGKYIKNKKVTLKFNKKTYKVKTNKKGVATFTIKNSVYKKLKTNKKYAYQVIYGKDKVKKTIKFKK